MRQALVAAAGVLLPTVLHADAAAAQQISVRPAIGVEVPVGSIGEIEDPGVFAGLSVDYHLSPRVGLGARGSVGFLRGSGNRFFFDAGGSRLPWPDLTAWNYVGEVRIHPLAAGRSAWDLAVDLGVGGSTFRLGGDVDASATFPALSGGLTGGVRLSPAVALLGTVHTLLVFSDSEDIGGAVRSLFEETWFFDFSVGARIVP